MNKLPPAIILGTIAIMFGAGFYLYGDSHPEIQTDQNIEKDELYEKYKINWDDQSDDTSYEEVLERYYGKAEFSIDDIEQTSEFIKYGPVINLAKNDHVSDNYSAQPFFGTPYFIYEDKIYYSLTASTSKELLGVDIETFQDFGDLKYGTEKGMYTPWSFMVDKKGIICGDQRMNEVDVSSFELLPEARSTNRYIALAKDNNNIYLPAEYARFNYYNEQTPCSVVEGIDSNTFEIIKTYPLYTKDITNVYYGGKKIVGADVDSFQYLSGTLSFDKEQVYSATRTVGKLVSNIPSNFSGELSIIDLDSDRSIGHIVLRHSNGVIDLLKDIRVETGWSESGYFIANKSTVYFLDLDAKLVALDIKSGEKDSIDLNIEITEEYNPVGLNYLFILDSNIYYLKGKNCNFYKSNCDSSLYSYNLLDGSEKLLTTSLSSRRIIGYDIESDKLYMGYSDGDAGCSWASYEEYSFIDLTSKDIGDRGRCQEYSQSSSPEVDELIERIKYSVGIGPVDSAVFENGISVVNPLN